MDDNRVKNVLQGICISEEAKERIAGKCRKVILNRRHRRSAGDYLGYVTVILACVLVNVVLCVFLIDYKSEKKTTTSVETTETQSTTLKPKQEIIDDTGFAKRKYMLNGKSMISNVSRKSVSAYSNYVVFLLEDGSVVTLGSESDTADWEDIVDVAAAEDGCIVGLKSDGTCVTTASDNGVYLWKNVRSLCHSGMLMGLRSDGGYTYVTPSSRDLQKAFLCEGVERIYYIGSGFIGVREDGTYQYIIEETEHYFGENSDEIIKEMTQEISSWPEMVDIGGNQNYVAGLKPDGTVVAVGNNSYGQCDVSHWEDIIQISVGNGYIVGLKSDGTVVAAGRNNYGQCDVSEWRDIVEISATGTNFTVGIKKDGTAVAVGRNNYGQCDVKNVKGIRIQQ